MTETREHRIKRMQMRSMRRGIKEMDLILDRFARANLDAMNEAEMDVYDALLSENDHDIYQWVTGQVAAPEPYGALIAGIVDQLPDTAD